MKSNFFSEPNESFPTSINNLSNNRNTLILQPNYIYIFKIIKYFKNIFIENIMK
jgi:hypothetical protein